MRGASSRRRRCGRRRRAERLAPPQRRGRLRLLEHRCCLLGPHLLAAGRSPLPASSACCRHPALSRTKRQSSRGASAACRMLACLLALPSAPAGHPTLLWLTPAGATPRLPTSWCARWRSVPGWRQLARQLMSTRLSSSVRGRPWRQRCACTCSTAAQTPRLLLRSRWQQQRQRQLIVTACLTVAAVRPQQRQRQQLACRSGGCAAGHRASCGS